MAQSTVTPMMTETTPIESPKFPLFGALGPATLATAVSLTVGLEVRIGTRAWYLGRSDSHTEHLNSLGRPLARWAEPVARNLVERTAAKLARMLVSRETSQTLTFLDDGSAPVGRGIAQAARGDLNGAATTFELAARNTLDFRDVPLYDLALVREAMGQLGRAFALYEQAWLLTRDERYLAAMGRVRQLERKENG